MGHNVQLHVCIKSGSNDGVARVAEKHLELLSDYETEALSFLGDLATRTGQNPGEKGGVSLWGVVGNNTDVGRFVEVLRPFWARAIASLWALWDDVQLGDSGKASFILAPEA